MNKSTVAIRVFLILVFTGLAFSGCIPQMTAVAPAAAPTIQAPQETAALTPTKTVTPAAIAAAIAAATATETATPTAVPFPALTLEPGSHYFSIDGKESFLLSRNITGKTAEDYDTLLEWTRQGGTRLIRVHLTHGWWGDPWIQKDWSINEKWARDWEGIFDQAQADGIAVIPVFGVWADWNNGVPDWGSPFWMYNPLNPKNGGELANPQELFVADSAAQKAWLKWVQALVERWQGRENIVAWEIFSEINIASGPEGHTDPKGGVDKETGVGFTDRAAAVIRTADTRHRPVTLSLAGVYAETDKWAEYYHQENLDFIEIHPYSDTLDRQLIQEVRVQLEKYQKPVMIGECGLWSMTYKPNAPRGITHAIWASLVSGALNGRALWDNDAYAIYFHENREEAIQFMQAFATIEQPVVNFAREVDFAGYQPLISATTPGVWGAALGNDRSAIGWYRDAASEPPEWNLKPVISKQNVTITVPGAAEQWRVDFYDTRTGDAILSSITVARKGKSLTIPLPDFSDSIAFKMVATP